MDNFDLKKLGVDYLLVNSTNKFLLEYVPIEENSVHKLTGFTGDVGDALVCPDGKILLFVDSRFHIQADKEVDHSKVEVVKLKLGQKIDDEICLKIKPDSILGVDLSKVSQSRYEYLTTLLKELNVKIKGYVSGETCRKGEFVRVDEPKEIKDNILITKSDELSYVCGIRCFTYNYSTKVDGKLLIIDGKRYLFTDYKGENARPLNEFNTFIKTVDLPLKVDKSSITAEDYSLIKNPVPVKSPVKEMKSVKTESELEHMKYCFDMTDKALHATRDWIMENENFFCNFFRVFSRAFFLFLQNSSAPVRYNIWEQTTAEVTHEDAGKPQRRQPLHLSIGRAGRAFRPDGARRGGRDH